MSTKLNNAKRMQSHMKGTTGPSSVFAANKFIEYRPGTLNVIISVPHGGCKRPSYIPDRDAGYQDPVTGAIHYDHKPGVKKDPVKCPVRYKKDEYTQELAILLSNELNKLTGKWPHMVINHLYRGKMDANADLAEATFGVSASVQAWKAYHQFIQNAKDSMTGAGLFLDIHGQSHPEEWIELGYLITRDELDSRDFVWTKSSIYSLAKRKCKTQADFMELLTGQYSLGALIEREGYKVIPSPSYCFPNGGNYYSGRHNIKSHGSQNGGSVDAIQIETPRYLRNKDTAPKYARSLAKSVLNFLQLHYSV